MRMARAKRTVQGAAIVAALWATGAVAQVTVVTAAKVHTMDAARPTAEAFAYGADGRAARSSPHTPARGGWISATRRSCRA